MTTRAKGRIRNRIAWAMLLSAILVLPVAFLALYYVSQMNSLTTVLAESDAELLRVGNTIIHNFLDVRNSERNYLLSQDTIYLTAARIVLDQVTLTAEKSRRLDPALKNRFDSLIFSLQVYRQLLDSLGSVPTLRSKPQPKPEISKLRQERNQILEQARNAPDPALTESLLNIANRLGEEIEIRELIGGLQIGFYERIEGISAEIVKNAEEITKRANERIAERKSRVNRLYVWGQRNIITAIIIFTALLVYFIIRLPNAIILPIKRIALALTRAEQGDLNIRVTINSNDELGELARQLNRVFARLRDFDERKANQILELDRRFRLLAKSINEGVLIVDRSQRIIYANPAIEPLLGVGLAEATGKSLREFPQLVDFVPHLEQILSGAGSKQECEILPHLPNSAVCFEALRDRSGVITAALVVVTNPVPPEKG
ncbi:MAG: HAMP domain-containing protein [candidate division WOR-3 bacterium]